MQRLWERGVKLESGLQAIVRDGTEGLEQALDYVYGSALIQQRCIFHKLRNVSEKCSGLDRAHKKQFMDLDIRDETKQAVLRDNAIRIFKL